MIDWKKLQKEVHQVIKLLDELIPEKPYLYLPLISAVFFWGIKQCRDWKDRIFAQKIWPVPGFIREKPDEFILDFFYRHPELAAEFKPELSAEETKNLREYFNKLYPVVGLEDPFLCSLFKEELAANDYRGLITEYENRIQSAKKDIKALERNPDLFRTLENFYRYAGSLGSDVLTQSAVQKNLIQIIEDHVRTQRQ
jgi:hypothetical protein